MVKFFPKLFLLLLLVLSPLPAYSEVPSITLEGVELRKGDGPEVLLQLLRSQHDYMHWSHIEMKPEEFQVYGEVISPKSIHAGTRSITIRTKYGSRTMAQVVRLRWFAYLVVATKDIKRGEVLSPDVLEVQLVEYKRSYRRCFSNIGEVVGMGSARSIKKGEPITDRDIERPYLVKRGDRVTVVVRSGAVDVEVEGIALEPGFKGSRIKVRVPKFRKDIEAVVISEKMVLLDLN